MITYVPLPCSLREAGPDEATTCTTPNALLVRRTEEKLLGRRPMWRRRAALAGYDVSFGSRPPGTGRPPLAVPPLASTDLAASPHQARSDPESARIPSSVPRGHRFAVAAENATVAEVARDILARGGSAADAAVAAVLTGGVTQPSSSGLGGGGFAVVWDAQNESTRSILERRPPGRCAPPRRIAMTSWQTSRAA